MLHGTVRASLTRDDAQLALRLIARGSEDSLRAAEAVNWTVPPRRAYSPSRLAVRRRRGPLTDQSTMFGQRVPCQRGKPV